jgi:Tfp pilus assembly protein PilO
MRIEKDILKTVCVLVVLVVLFTVLAWLPLGERREHTHDRIVTARKVARTPDQSTGEIAKLRKAVGDLTAVVERAQKVVPKTTELASMIRMFSTKMKQLGMTDPEIQTQQIVEGANYNVIPLSLKFQGDYSGFFQFIKAAEAQDRLIRIHDLQLKGNPTQDEPVSVSIQLTAFSEGGGGQER